MRKKSPLLIIIAAVGLITCFGIQFFAKTGVFKIWGAITYDTSLSSDEIAAIQTVLSPDLKLEHDLQITARYITNRNDLLVNEFISDILVPVVDFYNTTSRITAEQALALVEDSDSEGATTVSLISVNELSQSKRLLPIDDYYFLDNFDMGAIFRVITFSSDAYDTEIKPLVADLYRQTYPTKDTVLSFAQTGVTALSRGMYTKLNKVNHDATYFATNIKDYLSAFDLTHTSNESSFTNSASSSNICSHPDFLNTLTAIGLDIVELTGNHNRDCGSDAARNTIDIYKNNGIKIFGGGTNLDEATIPLEISTKDTHITLLGYNESTGGATYGSNPGANPYREDKVKEDISAAKARGDFVIVDIQYYECYCYPDHGKEYTPCDKADWSSTYNQKDFFRHIIDLGADMVVGTSAHQPQTYELYGDGVIYYGLGNLFFDQVWWPGTTRGLILAHYFYNGQLIQTRLRGTVFGDELQVKLMDEEMNTWFLNRLVDAKPKN